MVEVYTSQFRYSGPDRFDITAKMKTPFSPTWSMVKDYKEGRTNQKEYSDLYADLMNKSYITNHNAWRDVLNMNNVTFVCYCNPNSFCHRFLLAQYLEILGAKYCGEI
ncbi:MAG: hypothetical protein HN381_00020 [Bacteroidetes bacterium]|nr:hypothetical protein [Bacteroidota bacterium]